MLMAHKSCALKGERQPGTMCNLPPRHLELPFDLNDLLYRIFKIVVTLCYGHAITGQVPHNINPFP